MSTVELLPCPFCGGQAFGAPYAGGARVFCKGCGISTGTYLDMARAVGKWNRRTVRRFVAQPNRVFGNLERVVESIELDPRLAAAAILELRFLEKLLVALATLADTSPAPADNSPAALVAEFVDAARSCH